MPFLQEGGSSEADVMGGPVGSGLPAARLVVDPEHVLALRDGIEQECARLEAWLVDNRSKLNVVPPPGADPCSDESAKALGENGGAAEKAAWGYVKQLRSVADALGEIADEYRLTEDENAGAFGEGTK